MAYDGQETICNGIDSANEFTELDRAAGYQAMRIADSYGNVPYDTIRRLDYLRTHSEKPSHQAGVILGSIVSNSALKLNLPKDNSGLVKGKLFDDAWGHVYKIRGSMEIGA